MKAKTQVIKENSQYKTLINAVINRIGLDSVEDVNAHGIDGGYGGFIYYSDTVAFAMRHRKAIIQMLEDMADSLGEDVVNMVANFGVFRNNPMDSTDKKELYRYLGGCKCQENTIPNLMAWFAAEEVCRMFED